MEIRQIRSRRWGRCGGAGPRVSLRQQVCPSRVDSPGGRRERVEPSAANSVDADAHQHGAARVLDLSAHQSQAEGTGEEFGQDLFVACGVDVPGLGVRGTGELLVLDWPVQAVRGADEAARFFDRVFGVGGPVDQ